jgi:hypothetical protein
MQPLTRQISMNSPAHYAEVGHLFLLLAKGVGLVSNSQWQSGQGGPGPTSDEQEAMLDSEIELESVAKEIFLGLTGKKAVIKKT